MPLHAQAGDPRGTGSQATREDALLAGPQEGDDWLQKTTRRQLPSEDQKTTLLQRPEDNSQLSHVWPTRASLILRLHSLIGQRERSMPIFGAKPERNACAHIWGEARA